MIKSIDTTVTGLPFDPNNMTLTADISGTATVSGAQVSPLVEMFVFQKPPTQSRTWSAELSFNLIDGNYHTYGASLSTFTQRDITKCCG